MAIMPRPKGKARKIAYDILGVPANIAAKPTKKQRILDRHLLYEETSRVR